MNSRIYNESTTFENLLKRFLDTERPLQVIIPDNKSATLVWTNVIGLAEGTGGCVHVLCFHKSFGLRAFMAWPTRSPHGLCLMAEDAVPCGNGYDKFLTTPAEVQEWLKKEEEEDNDELY